MIVLRSGGRGHGLHFLLGHPQIGAKFGDLHLLLGRDVHERFNLTLKDLHVAGQRCNVLDQIPDPAGNVPESERRHGAAP
jgi:hypothetical protein